MAEKKDELRRLEKALSHLSESKHHFQGQKAVCLQPEFTSKTLYGENADTLTTFKRHELQVRFVAIPNEQISRAESKILKQMISLKERVQKGNGSARCADCEKTTHSRPEKNASAPPIASCLFKKIKTDLFEQALKEEIAAMEGRMSAMETEYSSLTRQKQEVLKQS